MSSAVVSVVSQPGRIDLIRLPFQFFIPPNRRPSGGRRGPSEVRRPGWSPPSKEHDMYSLHVWGWGN